MRKLLLLGTALVLTAMLMFSCNKNRFDFSEFDTVNASGQWKLPIGTASITLGQVLGQMGANNLIQNDPDGNYFVSYCDTVDNFSAERIWKLLDKQIEFPFPIPGIDTLPFSIADSLLPYVDTLKLTHNIPLNEMNNDSESFVSIKKLVMKSCILSLKPVGNLLDVLNMSVSSPDIHKEGNENDTLNLVFDASTNFEASLADYAFNMKDYQGLDNPCVRLHYGLVYRYDSSNDPSDGLTVTLGFREIVIKELNCTIDSYEKTFDTCAAFSFPLGNIAGQLSLVGTKLKIYEKSSFKNLKAIVALQQAKLFGGNAAPADLITPFEIDIFDYDDFGPVIDKEFTFTYNTEFDSIRLSGSINLNPEGGDNLICIYDTSSIVFAYDVMVPFSFNIPTVSYCDTMDINLSDISAPDFVEEMNLFVRIDSKLPINLNAQFYTVDKNTGMVTDTLFPGEKFIKGKFDSLTTNPKPETSEFEISITEQRVEHLMASDKIIMKFSVDTESQDIWLNENQGLEVTMKVDVKYNGDINLSQN